MANIIDKYYQTRSSVREAIKTLRTNIMFSRLDTEIKTLVVTSPQASEGKTTIGCFLGIAFAEAGKRVLMVETDCRRPMLANLFRQRPQYGTLQVIYGEVSVVEAAAETRQKGLYLMDCGGKITNPVEFVNSKRFAAFVEEAKKHFDIIMFDTPPLGSFIDSALLAARADGTVLVMTPGRTQSSQVKAVVEQLRKVGARILGVVMNRVGMQDSGNYYYYYYYNRYYNRYNTDNGKKRKKSKNKSVREG